MEGTDYKLTEEGLSLLLLPVAAFKLTTVVAIKPQETRPPSRAVVTLFVGAASGLVRCWSRFRLQLGVLVTFSTEHRNSAENLQGPDRRSGSRPDPPGTL